MLSAAARGSPPCGSSLMSRRVSRPQSGGRPLRCVRPACPCVLPLLTAARARSRRLQQASPTTDLLTGRTGEDGAEANTETVDL